MMIICPSCGIKLEDGNYYTNLGKVMSSEKLQEICKLSNNKAACINKVHSSIRKLTNIELNTLANQVIKDLKVSGIDTNFPDHFVTLEWLNVRKKEVPLDYKYAATTKLLHHDLSICIEFVDSINEGYLSFLSPELVKGVELVGKSFNVLEGNKIVAKGVFV